MTSSYRIPGAVTYQSVGDELILLNLENGRYYGLDEVGRLVFQALREGDSDQRIVDRICAEYEVGAARAAADLDALLTKLESEGLIQACE